MRTQTHSSAERVRVHVHECASVRVGVSCCHLHALYAFVLFALLKAMLSGLFFVLYAKHTAFSRRKLNLKSLEEGNIRDA